MSCAEEEEDEVVQEGGQWADEATVQKGQFNPFPTLVMYT